MSEATPNLSKPPRSLRTVTGWTILLMVVLRVVIGWHFFYEGVHKIKSKTFSATPYLMASTGPLRDFFRKMAFDPDGFERIKADYQKDQLDQRYELIVNHFKLDDAQKKALGDFHDEWKKEIESIVADPEFAVQVEGYKNLMAQVKGQRLNRDPAYLAERLAFDEKKVDAARSALLARLEGPKKSKECLTEGLRTLLDPLPDPPLNPMDVFRILTIEGAPLTAEQLATGPLPNPLAQSLLARQLTKLGVHTSPKSQTYWIDISMILGLCAIGVCLMLGLFTRLAALGAACMLTMFYLSMPPWLGVPDPAMIEGHYLFVNKNLIELVAVLMLASSRVGRWCGLDAFLGAMSDRRRRKRAEAAVLPAQSLPQNRLFAPDARPPVRDSQRV